MMISIIVPIYNAEKTIDRCISSILSQTYKDIELILINDGSSDNTYSICEYYAQKDSRVIFVNKPNSGVSNSRNVGLDIAQGEYVLFIDADDYIDETYIVSFFDNSLTFDMCIQGYIVESRLGSTERAFVSNNLSMYEIIAYTENNNMLNSPWAKLFKRSIIEKFHLKFDENISYGEDHLFVLSFLQYVKCISLSLSCGYHYIDDNVGSLSNKSIHPLKLTAYTEKCLEYYINMCNNSNSILIYRRCYINIAKTILECMYIDNAFVIYDEIQKRLSKKLIFPFLGLNLKQKVVLGIFKYFYTKVSYTFFRLIVRVIL